MCLGFLALEVRIIFWGVKTLSSLTPARVLTVGYLVVIIVGTSLLSTSLATVSQQGLSLVDSLFTATSATAVTGLIVVNTAEDLSFFGQLVVLSLIQIGGLGLMSMSTLVALLLGRKITFKDRIIISKDLNYFNLANILKVVEYVVFFTLGIEAVGAALLFIKFYFLLPLKKAAYYAVFHSISAFCNAGFDVFGNSLENFTGDIYINLVITALFIMGGLGFSVIADVYHRDEFAQFSLHTKVVLLITAVLIGIGVIGIFVLEFFNPATLGNLPLFEKLTAAYFQGVTPRTAGFNTVPIGKLTAGSLFLTIILMFIGASPGSTGGGLKTTTMGALLTATYSLIIGKENPELFGRTLPQEIIYKALAMTIISLLVIVGITLGLSITEEFSFIKVLFETVSAYGTVGLSTGITGELSTLGKMMISSLMFAGRVGPLTLAVALGGEPRPDKVKYPEEKILIG